MFDGESVPVGLAEMAPGPVLAAVLASIDPSRLSGFDRVVVLQARARQLAYDQAEFYASMVGVAEAIPDTEIEFASDEIRAALTWTRRAADRHLDLGYELMKRLPNLWEALHQGSIDLARARVIIDHTTHLEVEEARRVTETVLETASGLTTGQLAARLRRLIIETDPHSAEKRYQQGIAERRVMVEPNPDGTANLHGMSLPADRAVAVINRVNQLAHSLKTSDDPRTIDQIRADVFLDLLGGHPYHTTKTGGVLDLRVDLATLTRLADTPGEVGGWGPVISDLARQIADNHHGQWRVSVTDNRLPVWEGVTRRRPTTHQKRAVQTRQPTCVFPGCRMPATQSDLDHTQAVKDGGATTTTNLGPLCRHDHRLKHQGGWQLTQPTPGVHTWTSRLGHTYTTQPP